MAGGRGDRRLRHRPSAPRTSTRSRRCDAILLGAVGGPRWDDPDARVRPEQALFALRGGLELFANLRPVTVAAGARARRRRSGPEILEGVDLLIVRELTSGLYFGRPSEQRDTPEGRVGIDTLWYTEAEIRRVVRLAFELARGRRGRLTSVDKANVLATSRLWRKVVDETRPRLPRRRGQPPARRLVRDAPRPPARRRSTSSSPRTCSATSCRTRRRCSPAAWGCCPRRRSATGGRPTAGSACTSRSTAPRRTSPAATRRTRWARSCPRRCSCAGRSGSDGAARRRRGRGRARRSTTATAPRDLLPPDGDRAGLRVVGTREMTAAVVERLAARVGVASSTRAGAERRHQGLEGRRGERRAGRALRHDPARRHPGREHHPVARRQAAHRPPARRVRHALHRGRLARLQPQGHRVLQGRARTSAGRTPSSPPSARRATARTARRPTRTSQELVRAETPVVTIFGKSWLLHVTEVLGATPGGEPRDDRRERRAHRRARAASSSTTPSTTSTATRRIGTTRSSTLRAAREGGARTLVLCDTNGGTLTSELLAVLADTRASRRGRPDAGGAG